MLKKRLNNKKGFTLAELLIAVAIIGILVAISVPVFTSKLGQARVATDQANIRAAKAAAVAMYFETEAAGTFYYDAAAGSLVKKEGSSATTTIKGYGQSSAAVEGAKNAPKSSEGKANILEVEITSAGVVTLSWVAGA